MHVQRSRRLSPAFVVAMIALFVALGGTAGAVVSQAVPLAKRALTADNAKKLGGQTSAQIVSQASTKAAQQASQAPGPASTIAGIVTTKSQTGAALPDDNSVHQYRIACDSGQRVMAGGFNSDNVVYGFESFPSDQSTWEMWLGHGGANPSPANITLYAICVK